ncbi:hypothetical protein BBF96_06165 [Anoxybacter fermentans]|uniref:Uncharacterized protein n=1 Tax=Anoxybacter fermentans TaxID=1323375 RepID=A0A3Q9HPV9_9FIRM|nr:DUF5665 domain-containing protein [Anoxybacter fermentans]AZR73017.1 hypothetical protein BBF96_06165 [Anoxybacter fermentans]
MNVEEKRLLGQLANKVEELAENINKINIAEYIELIRSPRYMLLINFISGLARGLGVAIGATILGAIVLMILFRLAELNVPLIGFFIAKIVKIVQTYL